MIIEEISGMVYDDNEFKLRSANVTVRFTSDKYGETLSLSVDGVMITVPYEPLSDIINKERGHTETEPADIDEGMEHLNISVRAYNGLYRHAKCRTIGDVVAYYSHYKSFLRLPHVGETTNAEIVRQLKQFGYIGENEP